MKVWTNAILFIAMSIFPVFGRASGVTVGNGGDVIHCLYPHPIARSGTVVLQETLALERFRFLNEGPVPPSSRFHELKNGHETRAYFETRLRRSEWLYKAYLNANAYIDFDRIKLIFRELPDLQDDGFKGPLPAGCEKKQMLIRKGRYLYSYSWFYLSNSLSPIDREILRLHEILYFIGVSSRKHSTSVPTQNLIIFLMGRDPTETELKSYLQSAF